MDAAAAVEVVWARPRRHRGLDALLDRRERERLAALARAGDRDRFVAAHALARIVVGGRLGADPAAVRLGARCRRCGGPHGAPEVLDADPPLWLSLAHAGDRVAVAVSRTGPVGVDVEAVAGTDFAGFAAVALSPAEQRHRPPPTGAGRTRWWVRKEAVLKATGQGLTVAPAALTVSPPDEPPRLLGWDAEAAGGPAPVALDAVALRDLDLGAGYAGAVALIYPTGPGVPAAFGMPAEMEVAVSVGDGLLRG